MNKPYQCQVDNVPDELQRHPQWVLWQLVGDKKKPYQVRAPIKPAKVNDRRTWATFGEACGAARTAGLGTGFVFGDLDQLAFIDLDWKHSGQPSQLQLDIIARLDTFTEVSPSGKGAHAFVLVNKPEFERGIKLDSLGVEIYLRGRFSTITGDVAPYGLRPIAERTSELREVLAEVGAVKITAGQRNNTLMRRAGKKRHEGQHIDQIRSDLFFFNDQSCEPPLPAQEVSGIASRVSSYDVSGFLALPRAFLHSDVYATLSPAALKLLVDICAGYTGGNNGQLTAVFARMQCRGWNSPNTFYRALGELRNAGIVVRTRPGARYRPARYSVPLLKQFCFRTDDKTGTQQPTNDYLQSTSITEVYSEN